MKIKIPFKKASNPDKEMSLSEHLRELRNRILVCVILLVAAMILGLNYAPRLVTFLLDLGKVYHYKFVYISPQELLLQYFSVSLVFAVCITLPVTIYQVWAFARPGLRKNENLFFLTAMIFGLIFFGAGIYFAYRIMLPFMLSFLISLSKGTGITASVSVQNYISFLLTIFMIFGIIFELPVVSVLLTQMGLLSVRLMKAGRKVVIVAAFFVAALITPPDIISQIMVAVPMIFLYELSIVLCTLCNKLKTRKQKNNI